MRDSRSPLGVWEVRMLTMADDDKLSGFKLVPWESWQHWNRVREAVFSSSPAQVSSALDKIDEWQSRGHLPIAVEVTAELISIQQRDPCFSTSAALELIVPEEMLRLMYAMVIMRLINGVVDQSRKQNSRSVAWRAEAAGLPHLLVDVRHEVAHKELPGIALLQLASKQALEWLKVQYWEAQKQVLDNAHEHLKSKLLKHALFFHDSRGQQLAGSRKKKESHKELVKLVKSAVADTVLILVDGGLLEKASARKDLQEADAVIGENCDDATCSEIPSEDAFKHTLAFLCSNVPQLASLLLVRLIERITNACEDDHGAICSLPGRNRDTVFTGLLSIDDTKTQLSVSSEAVDINANMVGCNNLLGKNENDSISGTCKCNGGHHLITWVKWLLNNKAGKMRRDGGFTSVERSKSIKQVIGTDIDFRDLPSELVKELLSICLRSQIDKESRVEVVNLLVAQIKKGKLLRKAATLACLSSPPFNAIEDRRDFICEEASERGDAMVDKDATKLSLLSCEDALVESRKCLEILRTEYGTLLHRRAVMDSLDDRTSRNKMISEKNLFRDADCQNNERNQSLGVWTVIEEWRPCAIGMLPSTLSCTGKLPSFDTVVKDLQMARSDQCKVELDDQTKQQSNAQHGSALAEKDSVSNILCMESKELVAEARADENIPVKKLKFESDQVAAGVRSSAERNLKKELNKHTSPLQGVLLLDGVYQTCESGQFAAIQSAIHML